jgi:hypothetical protein
MKSCSDKERNLTITYIPYLTFVFFTNHEKFESNQDSFSKYIPMVCITITNLLKHEQKNLPHSKFSTTYAFVLQAVI